MLLVVGLALADDDLSEAIATLDEPDRVARRTTITVGVGFTLLSASVVPMVVAWPQAPNPWHYRVPREDWDDNPEEYSARLERQSENLHADRQAYVRATWSRTTTSALLAAAGVATLAVAPAWTLDANDRDAQATVGPTGVEITF